LGSLAAPKAAAKPETVSESKGRAPRRYHLVILLNGLRLSLGEANLGEAVGLWQRLLFGGQAARLGTSFEGGAASDEQWPMGNGQWAARWAAAELRQSSGRAKGELEAELRKLGAGP